MKTLIIDTSTSYLYISFVEEEKEIYKYLEEGNNDHSEKLVRNIEKGLLENNMEVKDFDRIIVGIGPGSYTGLRVGLTVCKVFSWTLNIPLFTLSSLNIVASSYFDKEGCYDVLMKCKKGVYYKKMLASDGKSFFDESQDEVITDEEYKEERCNNTIIDKDQYSFNGVNITKMNLIKVNDVHLLTPNYLR